MKTHYQLSESLQIPRVVIGLWQIADMERHGETLDPAATAHFMQPYAEAGFTAFDMADHYGSSEIIAGTFKNNSQDPDALQLFTKWVPKPGKITRNTVRKAVQTALERMNQNSIELMQFHAWHYPNPNWIDALFYLDELRKEGLIKNIGVTNFDAAHLRIALASGIPIVSNQVAHSVIDCRARKEMAEVCNEYGVKLLAYGTLAGGFLSNKWVGKPEPEMTSLTTWSQMKYKRFIDAVGGWSLFQDILEVLDIIARKHNTSIANIASRYMLENDHVAAVIIGARLGENDHIKDHKEMLNIEFDPEDIDRIREVQQPLNPIPGDCGDEYRKPPFLTASGDLSHHLETIPHVFDPVQTGPDRHQVFSGTPWEWFAGYSRAVRKGNSIFVSGTTATHGDLRIGGLDPAAQTHYIIDKIEGAITSLGGSLNDVVRTRIFVHDLEHWEAVARAHGKRFDGINPANTLVQGELVGEGYLVEIEAEARLD